MPNRNHQVTIENYRGCVAEQIAFLTSDVVPDEAALPVERVREYYDHSVSVDAAADDIARRAGLI